MAIQKNLNTLNIAIVTHTRTDGLSQRLRDWLITRANSTLFIGHPLYPNKKENSSMQIYQNGILTNDYKTSFFLKAGILLYIKDFLLTFIFIFKTMKMLDIAIGVDPLNTAPLIILKKIGIIKKVIYHTVDYTPNRFSNKIINNIYHNLDKFCSYNSDLLWNSSGRMNEGRVRFGAEFKRIAKTIVTPDGSNFDEKKRLPLNKINRKSVAFVGHLRERLGLELLLDAWTEVIKNIPDAKLIVIGGGPLLRELKKQAAALKISKSVTFTGFIEKHNDVDNKLRSAAIGIAMFEPVKDSYEYYSDAGKPKVYLAAGMPVITTRVPEISDEIGRKKAGVVIEYQKQKLSNAITLFLNNHSLYNEYRENAIKLSQKYIWNNIFEEAFSKSIKYFYEN